MQKKITADNFEKEMNVLAREFTSWWERGRQNDPNLFPELLVDNEWFDQFQLYLSIRKSA